MPHSDRRVELSQGRGRSRNELATVCLIDIVSRTGHMCWVCYRLGGGREYVSELLIELWWR